MSPVARCTSFAVRCILPVAWRMLSRCFYCTLYVVCCIFPIACCKSSIFCCTFSSGALHVAPCLSSAALLFVGSCLLHVVCGLFSCCLPQCPMACAVCRLSHVASRLVHVLRVVGCILHDARSLPHVVSCPLRVQSCMPSIAFCTVDSQRRRARIASLPTHARRFAE